MGLSDLNMPFLIHMVYAGYVLFYVTSGKTLNSSLLIPQTSGLREHKI